MSWQLSSNSIYAGGRWRHPETEAAPPDRGLRRAAAGIVAGLGISVAVLDLLAGVALIGLGLLWAVTKEPGGVYLALVGLTFYVVPTLLVAGVLFTLGRALRPRPRPRRVVASWE